MFNRKQIMRLFWPALIEQALVVSVGFISTLLVAGVSAQAVSGIGLVENINIVIISVLTAIAAGASVVVSQKIGAGDRENASKAAGNSVSAVLVSSCVLGALVIIFANAIVEFVFNGAERGVLDQAIIYFRFSGLSYPFLATSTTLASVFRATRDSRNPMFGSAIANIVLVAVSLTTIQGLKLGIVGSGISLVCARLANVLFLVIQIRRKQLSIHMPKLSLRFTKGIFAEIMRISVPAGLDQFLFAGGKLVIATFLKDFGTASITANSINGNIFGIVNLPGNAIFMISMTVIGQLYGAGQFKDVRRFMVILNFLTTGALIITCLGMLPLLDPFISLYGQSDECARLAREVSVFMLVVMPVFWPLSFTVPQMLRATGDVKYTMYVSMITMFIVRVAGSWFLGIQLGYGLLGIWFAMALDWVVRAAFFAPRAFLSYWNKDFRAGLKKAKKAGKYQGV